MPAYLQTASKVPIDQNIPVIKYKNTCEGASHPSVLECFTSTLQSRSQNHQDVLSKHAKARYPIVTFYSDIRTLFKNFGIPLKVSFHNNNNKTMS